ncbi:RelE/StbE replicon stabilization toxin [hydrothermal vent metagenome]|uniref:RelE/StbE replicon stabilization toxin n=1 Tax=hydrothermal vent metagenome TaxID=652676 RepID=A0A1W1CLY3_9ZZZZ
MYNIEYHPALEQDFKELGHSTTQLVFKKLKKIAQNPIIGIDLGNKANMNLTGYKKVYVDKKRVRIVYKIVEDKIVIYVIAVGKRNDMEVYQKASDRV